MSNQNQLPQPTGNGQEPEPHITKPVLAKRLEKTVRTISAYMRKGILPYYKIGGRSVTFKWSEVEAHLRDTCQVCRRNPSK